MGPHHHRSHDNSTTTYSSFNTLPRSDSSLFAAKQIARNIKKTHSLRTILLVTLRKRINYWSRRFKKNDPSEFNLGPETQSQISARSGVAYNYTGTKTCRHKQGKQKLFLPALTWLKHKDYPQHQSFKITDPFKRISHCKITMSDCGETTINSDFLTRHQPGTHLELSQQSWFFKRTFITIAKGKGFTKWKWCSGYSFFKKKKKKKKARKSKSLAKNWLTIWISVLLQFGNPSNLLDFWRSFLTFEEVFKICTLQYAAQKTSS